LKALDILSSPSINRITTNNKNDGSQQKEHRLYDQVNPMTKFKTVTLLCHCKDEKHCHRSIVKNMVDDLENKKI